MAAPLVWLQVQNITSCRRFTLRPANNSCAHFLLWMCDVHASDQANTLINQQTAKRVVTLLPSPHTSLTFSVMEMINGGSEKAPYKATTPDRRGKKKKKTSFISASALSRRFTESLQTAREKRCDNFQSLCSSFIPALQQFWQRTGAWKENLPYDFVSFFQGQALL